MQYPKVGTRCRLKVRTISSATNYQWTWVTYCGILRQVDLKALTATIWDSHWGPITGRLVDLTAATAARKVV